MEIIGQNYRDDFTDSSVRSLLYINMNERMNGQKGCVIASFDTNLF